jgi:hypothetical protein
VFIARATNKVITKIFIKINNIAMKILVITLLVALAINTKAEENGVLDKGWMH